MSDDNRMRLLEEKVLRLEQLLRGLNRANAGVIVNPALNTLGQDTEINGNLDVAGDLDITGSYLVNGSPLTATDPDAIHDNVANEINLLADKDNLEPQDIYVIEDLENSYSKKKVRAFNILPQYQMLENCTGYNSNLMMVTPYHGITDGNWYRIGKLNEDSVNVLISCKIDLWASAAQRPYPGSEYTGAKIHLLGNGWNVTTPEYHFTHEIYGGEIGIVHSTIGYFAIYLDGGYHYLYWFSPRYSNTFIHGYSSIQSPEMTLVSSGTTPPSGTLIYSTATKPTMKHSIGVLGLGHGVTSPATDSNLTQIYVDSADGLLKSKNSSGTVSLIRYDDNAIHNNVTGEINAITEKTSLVDNDLLLIEDSAASNVKKKVKNINLINVLNLPNQGSNPTYSITYNKMYSKGNSIYSLNQDNMPSVISGLSPISSFLSPLSFYGARAVWTGGVDAGTNKYIDHHPNANHLTWTSMGGGMYPTYPLLTFCPEFDGSTSYCSRAIGGNVSVNTHFTFGAWVYLDSVTRNHGIVRMGTTTVSWTIIYYYNAGGGYGYFELGYYQSDGTYRNIATINHNTIGWVFVGAFMQFDGSGNNNMNLYVNLASSGRTNEAWTAPRAGVGNFEIGRGATGSYWLDGKLATCWLAGNILTNVPGYYNITRGFFTY